MKLRTKFEIGSRYNLQKKFGTTDGQTRWFKYNTHTFSGYKILLLLFILNSGSSLTKTTYSYSKFVLFFLSFFCRFWWLEQQCHTSILHFFLLRFSDIKVHMLSGFIFLKSDKKCSENNQQLLWLCDLLTTKKRIIHEDFIIVQNIKYLLTVHLGNSKFITPGDTNYFLWRCLRKWSIP